MKKNVLLAQSGGPTAVINSSIVGAFDAAKESGLADRVFSAVGGIDGVISEKLLDMTAVDDARIRALRYSPSSGLFSCRHNLSSDFNDPEYKRIFDVLEAHNIGYFFYNGGNDSMDTACKLNQYAKLNGIDVKVNGIPKTIDNDLFGTDHCPGFGSAAKYLNISLQESAYDTFSYPTSKTVIITETMGRNAGWLAASTALAEYDSKQIADLIYLPETVFDLDKFLSDISDLLDKQTMVYVVVSEGLRNADKSPFFSSSTNSQDKFGHHQLGGLSQMLASIVKEKIIKRVKTENHDIGQRCASHILSKTDYEEAYLAGRKAVEFAFEGISGVMSAFERKSDSPYSINIVAAPLENAANVEKMVPLDWIDEKNSNVTEKLKDYVRPLIRGEVQIPYINGFPAYEKFTAPQVERKLEAFR